MKKTAEFKMDGEMKFSAEVKLNPNSEKTERFEFFVDKNENLTFDDVEFKAFEILEKNYPEDCFPKATIVGYSIEYGGIWSPVVSESDTAEIEKLKKSGKTEKFLVLPDARYSLTPECEFFMKLKEAGLAQNVEFDLEKMRELMAVAKKDR